MSNLILGVIFLLFSVLIIFLCIGISSLKAKDAVGFFSFTASATIEEEKIKNYNRAVAMLWFVVSVFVEIVGIPILFLEQNSPLFLVIIFAMVFLVIGMMIAYTKIEAKYRKQVD